MPIRIVLPSRVCFAAAAFLAVLFQVAHTEAYGSEPVRLTTIEKR